MMEFGDSRPKRITRFIYKWIWCSWVHHNHKCWPRDHDHWHCTKCHPCSEEIDIVILSSEFKWF